MLEILEGSLSRRKEQLLSFCSPKILQLATPSCNICHAPAPNKPPRCRPTHPGALQRPERITNQLPTKRTIDGSPSPPRSQSSVRSSHYEKFAAMISTTKTFPRRRPTSRPDCRNGRNSTYQNPSAPSSERFSRYARAWPRFCTSSSE